MTTRTIDPQLYAAIMASRRNKAMPSGSSVFPLAKSPLGNDSLLATLFERRGWTLDSIAAINDPDPGPFLDMDVLVDYLKAIHDSGLKIVVMPDYDTDGITAGITGWAGLSELGFNVGLYVPDHNDGHDIIPAAVDKLKATFPDAVAVITCDAGVNSHAGIQRGKDFGMTMLVTDHHLQEDLLSPADVIVNPSRIEDPNPRKSVCGAFVMWQVLNVYARRYAPTKVRSINLLRLFAGLGTVADVMQLTYANRQMVRDSVAIARSLYVPIPAADTATEYDVEDSLMMAIIRAEGHHPNYISAFEGFAVMLKAFREHGRLGPLYDKYDNEILDEDGDVIIARARGPLREINDINEDFYGFYVAPALNSVRRIDGDTSEAFGIFTADGVDAKYGLITKVMDGNYKRREDVKTLMEQIKGRDQPLKPYLWLTDAKSGMLGLVANQLMQELGHPVAIIHEVDSRRKKRSGSMRAPDWFDIISTLGKKSKYGYDIQGHEQACGVHLADALVMEQFVKDLAHEVAALQAQALVDGVDLGRPEPDLLIGDVPEADADLADHDDMVELGLALEGMAPFGTGFEAPKIGLALDLTTCKIEGIGTPKKHLRITTRCGLRIYWWNQVELVPELRQRATDNKAKSLHVIAQLQINEFMEHLSPQFTIDEVVK